MVIRRGFVAVLLAVAGLASACQVPVVLGGGGTPTPCWQGSFNVAENLNNRTFSLFGLTIGVAVQPGGTAQLVTTASSWTLTVDESLAVSANGNPVGTATVKGSATGGLTANGSTLTFSVKSVSGTAAFVGTGPAAAYSGSVDLSRLGDVVDAFGLNGTATVTCGNPPVVTFTGGGSHDVEVDL